MKKQGISLMILVTTVLIITILTGTIIFAGKEVMENLKELKFVTDMANVEYAYMSLNETEAEKGSRSNVIVNLSTVPNEIVTENFPNETLTGTAKTLKLKYLRYDELGLDINSGKFQNGEKDYYAISPETNTIYYIKGEKLNNKVYFTLTPELRKKYNISNINDLPNDGIIVEESVNAKEIDVYVPKCFRKVHVEYNGVFFANNTNVTKNRIQYNLIKVKKSPNVTKIIVEYDGKRYTTEIGLDKVKPQITIGKYIENKQTGDVVLTDVIAKDNSGKIKSFKYELGYINENEAKDYFNENGYVLKNNKIHLADAIQKFTIYAEDFNGNYAVMYNSNIKINPELSIENMIPIRFEDGKWIVCKKEDPLWFDYSSTSKRWANMMLSDGKYKAGTVAPNQIIEDSELGSMFVWIPKFSYSINNFQENKKDSQNVFDVEFMLDNDKCTNGEISIDDYDYATIKIGQKTPMIKHPIMKNMEGFWIAKFPLNKEGKSTPNGDFDIKDIEGAIKSCNKFTNSFGTIVSNLTSNMQWGAVAYLTSSKYGKIPEINTGRQIANNGYKLDAYKLSNTGNVYGIYDLNSRYGEYVAGYYKHNANALPTFVDDKWDVFDFSTQDVIKTLKNAKKGNALYETLDLKTYDKGIQEFNSCYGGDKVRVGNANEPFMLRGGVNDEYEYSGIFSASHTDGHNVANIIKYRPVIRLIPK